MKQLVHVVGVRIRAQGDAGVSHNRLDHLDIDSKRMEKNTDEPVKAVVCYTREAD